MCSFNETVACNNTQKYAEIRRNAQAKTPSKDLKQKHAGGYTERHFKPETYLTEPQGKLKN